ncbi:type VI secretion system-associated FHA domain protein TagH [Acetobacter sp. TBRC 12305]|uniref:Type VI secretion system-associated FHA domain protein TagH n=1 Tax=Acetobacter garciniae TaxID=2817435 RepID=A0A939HNQ4_9PROT|nr:type VI secretion system-associated FHA domain protein TagH [Acetobacter garciniae]MBO1326505.1 type VI secretion system-associated FHA domain protein TagH [Acetobacter garciniae]MBX0346179.1 type VI secretion system-associated FHA domain protein TagH [Acetobacter garciniae]
MTLTLTVLRCPDAVYPETRHVTGGELRIGRGPDNDWVLADPERHLSKRHCIIAFHQGGWAVADISTNGTFVNDGAAPLGHGTIRELRTGDRIRIGTYEIEAQIAPAAYAPAGQEDYPAPPLGLTPGGNGPSPLDDPFTDALFGTPSSAPGEPARDSAFIEQAFGNADPLFGAPPQPAPVILPDDFSPPTSSPDFIEPAAIADHIPAFGDAFAPPPARILLPDDDDWDLSPIAPPPAPSATPAPAPDTPDGTASPQDTNNDDFAIDDPVGFSQGAAQGNPFVEPADRADRPVAPVAPATAPHAAVTAGGDLMSAFLAGAGLSDMPAPADPQALMGEIGATFRAMVSGLRQALIARATIKGEFRIEQTMIRARGNNPLKFSAHDDDALCALLGLGRRVDMRPDVAVGDTLRDMRLHELATMAAMQDGVRAVMARLDPARLRASADEAGGMALLPAQKKARAFDSFEKEYRTVTNGLADNFDAVFGQAFARAYETALQDIQDRGTP